MTRSATFEHPALSLGVLVLGIAAVIGNSGVSAGQAGDLELIARGKAIAEAHCSECHAVGLDDETPSPVNANTAFRMLRERYPIPMLEAAADTGEISGHDEMPGFDFSVEDMRALLAFIDSFTPDKPGYVLRRAPD